MGKCLHIGVANRILMKFNYCLVQNWLSLQCELKDLLQ